MDAHFTLQYALLGYADTVLTQAPRQKLVDWSKSMQSLQVENPGGIPYTVAPASSLTIFDGTRALAADATTAWGLTQSPLNNSVYRLTWTGGTNPVLRADRGLQLTGEAVTVAVGTNATATFTIPGISLNTFAAVQVGDSLWVPGPTTGDAATPFSVLNQGLWTVLSVSTYSLTCTRPIGQTFQAVAETQTPTSNGLVTAFAAAGVQLGDSVDLSAGFSTPTLKTYTPLLTVTSTFVEFQSMLPLSPQSGITPGATGVVFYSQGKRMVFLEVDQEAVVQANGSTGSTERLSPFIAADPNNTAAYLKVGPCWSLTVVNRSINPLNLYFVAFG